MENEKIKLTVKIPCNAAVDYAVTADSKAPLSYSVADGVCEYIFDLTQGEHTLKVQSIPKKRNKIGDFKFMFTSGSSKKHYLNHLFAFRYDVHCFTMELSIYVHRDADIKIGPISASMPISLM